MNADPKLLYSPSLPAISGFRKATLSPAVLNNKLEALRMLANSILAEVSSMKISHGTTPRANVDLATEVQRFEEDLIRTALMRAGGRQRQAAVLLGVKPSTLHAKMKRYGMIEDNMDGDGEEDGNPS